MSLKAFHFLFIVLAILLSLLCSVIGFQAWRINPESAAIAFGIGFALLSVLLVFYGVWFFKKAKKIIV